MSINQVLRTIVLLTRTKTYTHDCIWFIGHKAQAKSFEYNSVWNYSRHICKFVRLIGKDRDRYYHNAKLFQQWN